MARATYTDMTSNDDVSSTVNIDERTQKAGPTAQVPNVNDGATATTDKTYRVAKISTNAVRPDPKPPTDPDTAPKFSAASYDRTVAENSEVGSVVGDPVRVTEHTEKTNFTYSLKDTISGDDSYFTIGTTTGQIRVGKVDFPNPTPAGVDGNCDTDTGTNNIATCPGEADPSLDYETKKTYTLTVTATDASKTSRGKGTTTVNVTLDDLNESPYFDKVSRDRADDPITYAETRKNAVMQLAVTEPDGSGLEWEVVGTDAADFTLADADSIPGEDKKRKDLMFKSQPDFENPTDRAHNADGIPGISTETGTADDAAENGTYKVTVRVTETAPAAGPRKSAELDVTVTLANSRETGTAYLTLLQPEVNTPIGYVATDPDQAAFPTPSAHRWYYAKVDEPDTPDPNNLGAQWTEISGNTGDDATYTPVAGQVGKKLLVLLTYTDTADQVPNPNVSSKMVAVSENPVRADVSNAANNSPDFATDKAARSIDEDKAVPGAKVGTPVDLVNEDKGEILTYDLDDNSNPDPPTPANDAGIPADYTFFDIDRATGQIMVKKQLSAEATDGRAYGSGASTAGKYVFWVRATDPSNDNQNNSGENRDEIEVTVTVNDINEAPKVLGMSELVVNEADSSNKNFYLGLEYRVNPANPSEYLSSDSSGWIPAATSASTTSDNLYTRSEEDVVDGSRWSDNPIMGDDGHLFEYSVAEDGISRRLHFKSPPGLREADGRRQGQRVRGDDKSHRQRPSRRLEVRKDNGAQRGREGHGLILDRRPDRRCSPDRHGGRSGRRCGRHQLDMVQGNHLQRHLSRPY